MKKIQPANMRAIYAMAKSLGMSDGSKDDDLHILVMAVTGKESIATLTAFEGESVASQLRELMKGKNQIFTKTAKSKKPAAAHTPGMMTAGQQKKAWALMYKLVSLDSRTDKSPGERMVAAIKKILAIDATVEKPFAWVTTEQGGQLIDMLKRYVNSLEKSSRAS